MMGSLGCICPGFTFPFTVPDTPVTIVHLMYSSRSNSKTGPLKHGILAKLWDAVVRTRKPTIADMALFKERTHVCETQNVVAQREPLLDVEDQITKSLKHQEVTNQCSLFFGSLCLGGSFPIPCGEPLPVICIELENTEGGFP